MATLSEENSIFNFNYDLDEQSELEAEESCHDFSCFSLKPEFEDFTPLCSPTESGESDPVAVRRAAGINRKNKKDDFDYNHYIKAEMVRQKATDLDPSVKKRMIQKIRNRMSAQRSRQRQKNMLQILEQENQTIKQQNSDLFRRLTESQRENVVLKERIANLEATRRSASTSDNEDTLSHASSELVRENRKTSYASHGNVFLVLVAVLAITFVPFAGGRSGNTSNSAVKMGGVVPFFAPTTSTSAKAPGLDVSAYCRKFCKREEAPQLGAPSSGRAVQVYLPSSQKDTSTLVCFDPRSKGSYRDAFRVLVDNQTFSYLNPAHSYYGAFSRVEPEMPTAAFK